MEEIIKRIHDEVMDYLQSIDKKINLIEFDDTYKQYLERKYIDVFNTIKESNPELIDIIIKSTIDEEEKRLTELDYDGIMSYIVEDEAFEKLLLKSNAVFNTVVIGKRINDDSKYEEEIGLVKSLFEKVRPFNKDRANDILSETVLDLMYYYNKTDKKSLRLSRYQ